MSTASAMFPVIASLGSIQFAVFADDTAYSFARAGGMVAVTDEQPEATEIYNNIVDLCEYLSSEEHVTKLQTLYIAMQLRGIEFNY